MQFLSVCVCVCVCVILSQVMLCCLAETILLHIFVISAIFLTLITESEEREREREREWVFHRWSDDETWTFANTHQFYCSFPSCTMVKPKQIHMTTRRGGLRRRTVHRYEWGLSRRGVCVCVCASVCVCVCVCVCECGGGRMSGLSPPLAREQFSLVLIHLYRVSGRQRESVTSPLCCTESHWAKHVLHLTGLVLYREIKQHTNKK